MSSTSVPLTALADFRGMPTMIREDTGPDASRAPLAPHAVSRPRVLDPARTDQGTPRGMTRLFTVVWRDRAGLPELCVAMRRTLGLQVRPHRPASGFPFDDVRVAGKTGCLPTVRTEVGVVTASSKNPDGGRCAVGVFTRSVSTAAHLPSADAVISTTAGMAVDAPRAAR
ncbi:serine hydrolase [Streptomyces sp. AC627_RSS907]|uniref:serine hydrolase n=1 Tax=Streptomyces sp. AC627_RSS907 TaxID=2823684 RepID=UPI001C27AE6C